MHPSDLELKSIMVSPRKATQADAEVPANVSASRLTVVIIVKWVKIRYAILNVCVTASDLMTIVTQCM